MDAIAQWLSINGKFLGVEWHFWKVIGWTGNVVFFSRFFVQWWATEKQKQVVVPNSFWWLSLIGSLMLLSYGLHRKDSVFILAYAFTWVPYIRNLVISWQVSKVQRRCKACNTVSAANSNFCPQCGAKLDPAETLEDRPSP